MELLQDCCYVNPLDEEYQHEKVIKRLLGIQQDKADTAIKQQAAIDAELEAKRLEEMQAEIEIQKTIGSTQHFDEGEDGENMYGMEQPMDEMEYTQQQNEQENDF